jgi:raffinose/stachyose/melibiose transport system permease protein
MPLCSLLIKEVNVMFNLSYKAQRKWVLLTFLFLPLLLLCTFTFYPAAKLFYYSFTAWDGFSKEKPWVGWENYKEVFKDPEIFGVFTHNIAYLLLGIVQNAIALFFAVILNTKLRGRKFFRLLFFTPFIMNGVAVAFMFGFFFDTERGSLNLLLQFLGFDHLAATSWLGGKTLVNYALAAIGVWKYMGFNMVIYLGALQAIPSDIYEASTIDGATGFQTFRHITLPNLMKIIELNLFLTVSGALEVFDLPFILTKGGPAGASSTFVLKTIETAFQFNNNGLASAMSVVLLLMVMVLIGVQRLILKRRDN